MARIKLNLPETFRFSTEVTVRVGDINYGGDLGNDAVLGLVHEARLQWLKQHGFSEANAGGAGMIMVDAAIVYVSQAFHGDVLKIEADAADFSTAGCDFLFRIANKATGREVARVKTGVVFFDYAAGNVVKMPETFRAALSAATAPAEPAASA